VANFTPNYQLNVVHAFGTAPKLAEFITTLRDQLDNPMKVNVAGHSLGNMVVSSAISDYQAAVNRYFLIDAAVAAEAYDGAQGNNQVVQPDDSTAFLPHTQWNKEFDGIYPSKLWPTNWHQLFKYPISDARQKLTWRDRFAPQVTTNYYDFHSTGEEVLGYDDAHAEYTPSLAGVLARELATFLHITRSNQKGQPNGYQSWLYQEQLKGRTTTGKILGSNYGGWGFNILHFKKFPGGAGVKGPVMVPTVLRPREITNTMLDGVFTDEVLREDPFFLPGGFWTNVGTWLYDRDTKKISWRSERLSKLYAPETGSTFASTHRDTLLARMIPAMSPAAGRIPVPKLSSAAGEERNFDMNGTDIRPRIGPNPPWPANRTTTDWRHSDLREVAYPYVRRLYERIAEKGFLKGDTP